MSNNPPTSPGGLLATGVFVSIFGGVLLAYSAVQDIQFGVFAGAIVAGIGQLVSMVGAAGVGVRVAQRYSDWEYANPDQ